MSPQRGKANEQVSLDAGDVFSACCKMFMENDRQDLENWGCK